jgi:NAD+ synthase
MGYTLSIPDLDYNYAVRRIKTFIKDKVEEAGMKGVVIGLSGGLDSSVTAVLAVRALGKERVFGLLMPEESTTPLQDIEDALELCGKLGIKHQTVNITRIYKEIKKSIPFYMEKDRVASGNILARIRMMIWYYHANINRLLVCGTSDRSELLLGYFTKYGDGGVDILPLGDIYKTQVRILAKKIGLPENIYLKPSSPRFWPGHLAEQELGMSYEIVDTILHLYFDLRMDIERVIKKTNIERETVSKVINRVLRNEHKRMMPPIPKIQGFSLQTEWWMPWNPSA